MKSEVYRNLKDEEIIDKIRTENQKELFDILYARYSKKVYEKCLSFIKDKGQANDFKQDIFAKVYEKLDSFKGMSSFSSWLYAITYNHCIEYLRNHKKLHYPEWNRKNEIPDKIDEVEEEDLTDIKYERLMKILEMIHPEEKALLLMKYKDDMPVRLIQKALKISESAAKMRIKRAKMRVLYMYKKMYALSK